MASNFRVTKLPAGKIIDIRELQDGTYEVLQAATNDSNYVLIDAESLSINDEFMEYRPKTDAEERTKQLIDEAIRKGVKNFYRPKVDPSFTENEENICFEPGKQPAVGKSYVWWMEEARKYKPNRFSRLGTRLEYGAFLGVLLKKLIEERKNVAWAWNAVCNDSHELGHYWNSENSKYKIEPTGSRYICDFYDLANTFKILRDYGEEGEGWWLASGSYISGGANSTISNLVNIESWRCSDDTYYAVGWIVLS